jgi:hypothetical protein
MQVFNVLFKGVQIKHTTWAKAFREEQTARAFIEDYCSERDLTIMSSMGWNSENTMDDYRAEDRQGNTYYFVIYRQTI